MRVFTKNMWSFLRQIIITIAIIIIELDQLLGITLLNIFFD